MIETALIVLAAWLMLSVALAVPIGMFFAHVKTLDALSKDETS